MSNLKCFITLILLSISSLGLSHGAQQADSLAPVLESSYRTWRTAFLKSDYPRWKDNTAAYRQMRVRNQAVSERRAFPASVFNNPIKPASLTGLKLIGVLKNGNSVAATYFGPVDFGVGGTPKDNALTLLFVRERSGWKYDTARFFNLEQMPALRRKLSANNPEALKEEGFQPLESVPPIPLACKAPRYIAKIFVDCPGRVVKASVNGISPHSFSDTRTSEVIWGGADLGKNSITISVKDDPTATAKGPLEVTVYLMPTIRGNLPVKAYQLLAKADDDLEPITANFTVDAALLATGKPKP